MKPSITVITLNISPSNPKADTSITVPKATMHVRIIASAFKTNFNIVLPSFLR